jgi:hypothetical protein
MNKVVLLSALMLIGTGAVIGSESREGGGNLERERERIEPLVVSSEAVRGAEVIEERDEEEEVIEVGEEVIEAGEVVERGAGQVWEMQRRIDALQEIMETYERSSRRMLRMLVRVDEREETLRKIRTMVNRCGNIHLLRQPVIEHIYDTAWTINGEHVMGRTSGWRWYELGTGDWARSPKHQGTVLTRAYTTSRDVSLQFESIAFTLMEATYDVVYQAPQWSTSTAQMNTSAHIPVLPECVKGEVAICTFYTDESSIPTPNCRTASSKITGFSMYTSTQGANYAAMLQPPIAAALRITIADPGDGNTLGIPKDMRWRAIIGEYTAPGA